MNGTETKEFTPPREHKSLRLTQYEGLATVMRVPQLDPAVFGPLHALARAMGAAPPAAAQPAAGPVPVPATVVAAQATAPREVAPLPLLLSEMGVDLAQQRSSNGSVPCCFPWSVAVHTPDG